MDTDSPGPKTLEVRPENAPAFQILVSEIELTFVRSSGPGGQNVNKVNSKAVLRWNLLESESISPELGARLRARLSAQLTVDGDLVVMSDRFRDQPRNREDCFEKLAETLARAASITKRRKKTKPTFGSKKRNQVAKKQHSNKKKLRSRPFED